MKIFLSPKDKTFLVLVAILLLAAALRFYNLPSIVYFEFDDQYNSYLVYDLVKNHHLSLVGQQMSFGGMFLGPWHYLYLVPFYLLSNLHPIGGYIGEATIGLLIIFSYYWVGSRLFSPKTGLIAAFCRSVIFSLIMQDHNIGPAYPSELVGIWFIYFLYRLHQGQKTALVFLAFLFGLMFTVHLVILPLAVVAAVSSLMFRQYKLTIKTVALSLLAFIIPVVPQLVFEIKHKFVHLQSLTQTVISDGRVFEGGGWMYRLWYELTFNLGNFYKLFEPNYLPGWLGWGVFAVICALLVERQGQFTDKFHRWFFPLTSLLVIVYYLVYPRHVPEYYFMPFIILQVLYVSALLAEVSMIRFGKVLLIIALVGVAASNGKLLIDAYRSPVKYNLAQKDAAVKTIIEHQRGKGDYSVSYFIPNGRQYGFQYFFKLYGLEPRPEVTPPIYSLVMPYGQVAESDLSRIFGDIGVIFPEDEPEQGKR